jgi:FkbM family methyltransferase
MLKLFAFMIFDNLLSINYQYPMFDDKYYSQKGQDKFVNENIFNNKTNGFFIEIGANNGINFSNTYFFEKNLNWQGICVEPYPELFEELKKNRNCYAENSCISSEKKIAQFLKCYGFITEMYSGIIDDYDPRHIERINNEIEIFGGAKEIIEVQCISFDDLTEKYKIDKVDLLSIDIEGGEEKIIKSIDFSKIYIDVIIIENNFNDNGMRDYLKNKGYCLVTKLGKDDIFKKIGTLNE